jgi:hypothetical protein
MRAPEWISRQWSERPLVVVMAAAVAARLLTVLFSRGFAFYDDHFSVVEIAQRWVDGHRDWLGDPTQLRSLVYPGLHAALFWAMERLGAGSVEAKMLAARALHAAWSLGTVYFGYQAALALSDVRTARLAGLVLALFWLSAGMSGRNLIEVACQPPLVAALYLLVRRRRGSESPRPASADPTAGSTARDELVAGALLGLAFVLRFQVAVMAGATGLWLLVAARRPLAAIRLGAGFALSVTLLLGVIDWLGYGRPFSSLIAYVEYNSAPTNIAAYPQGPWHQYLGLIAGVMLPPLGLALLFGFFREWRRIGIAVWPAVAFIAFHSWYPNKQERFILPALPYVLLVAVVGWERVRAHARGAAAARSIVARAATAAGSHEGASAGAPVRGRRAVSGSESSAVAPLGEARPPGADGGAAAWLTSPRVNARLWAVFWVVNAVLFFLVGMNDWKRARWEALEVVGARPDARGVLLEIDAADVPDPPLFYLGRELPAWELTSRTDPAKLRAEIEASGAPAPNYVAFIGEKDLERRVARAEGVVPGLVGPVARVEPSLLDRALRKVNPRQHVNLPTLVYRSDGAASPTSAGR